MNEQHRSAAAPSKAEIVFSVTTAAVSSGVQIGGAAVAGIASGFAKGLWGLARTAAGAAADSQPYKRAVTGAAQAWSSASKAVEVRHAARRQEPIDGCASREEAD